MPLGPGEMRGIRREDELLEELVGELLALLPSRLVPELESQVVLGLHYGGKFPGGQYAVPLWMLTKDPLLKKAQVNFI